MWVSTNGSSITCDFQRTVWSTATNSYGDWVNIFTNQSVQGYSGANDFMHIELLAGGNATQQIANGRNGQFRWIFKANAAHTTNPIIYTIAAYGASAWNQLSNLGMMDRLYSYDINQNALFPAGVRDGDGKYISDKMNRDNAAISLANLDHFNFLPAGASEIYPVQGLALNLDGVSTPTCSGQVLISQRGNTDSRCQQLLTLSAKNNTATQEIYFRATSGTSLASVPWKRLAFASEIPAISAAGSINLPVYINNSGVPATINNLYLPENGYIQLRYMTNNITQIYSDEGIVMDFPDFNSFAQYFCSGINFTLPNSNIVLNQNEFNLYRKTGSTRFAITTNQSTSTSGGFYGTGTIFGNNETTDTLNTNLVRRIVLTNASGQIPASLIPNGSGIGNPTYVTFTPNITGAGYNASSRSGFYVLYGKVCQLCICIRFGSSSPSVSSGWYG